MKDVDPRLLEVFAIVARDLRSAGLRAELRMESWVTESDFWDAMLYVDGKRMGIVRADPAAGTEGQVLLLADQIQDYVLEFVWRGPEAVVWPRCRSGHNHPMVVECSPDGPLPWPYWICPFDRDHRVLIGGGP
jgi:hypothetical protein